MQSTVGILWDIPNFLCMRRLIIVITINYYWGGGRLKEELSSPTSKCFVIKIKGDPGESPSNNPSPLPPYLSATLTWAEESWSMYYCYCHHHCCAIACICRPMCLFSQSEGLGGEDPPELWPAPSVHRELQREVSSHTQRCFLVCLLA